MTLVHEDIVNTVTGCHHEPVSSRFTTILLKAVPFNISVAQAYAQASDYDDNEVGTFDDQQQNVIDQTPKDVRMHMKTGKGFADSTAMTKQMGEDSDYWSLPPFTILCWRSFWSSQSIEKKQPKWTTSHKIDYILFRKRLHQE